jgi:hypothetical protein
VTDIVTSQAAVPQRYQKMYREIHNDYLKNDFANLQDFNKFVADINKRITELETMIITELGVLQAGLTAHTHISPPGVSGGPTSPPVAPPYTSAMSATAPVLAETTFVEQRNTVLQATGPAFAPAAQGGFA